MTLEYSSLYESADFTSLHSAIDAEVLSAQVNQNNLEANDSSSRLAIAAYTATAALFDEMPLSEIGREEKSYEQQETLQWAASHWRAYLESVIGLGFSNISLADLALFSACGVLNKQQSEVRTLLKSPFFRELIHEKTSKLSSPVNWRETCEAHITLAVLLLVRQSDDHDVVAAEATIQTLILLQQQKKDEIARLSERQSRGMNLVIVGLYHLAHATIRTSEYLANGRVTPGESGTGNFEIELRRLLSKSEDFAEASGSAEYLLWTRSIGMTLWTIFNESIWKQALGLSGGIDALLTELSKRESPIFSLLPSQQEAMQSDLLNPAKIAVVLQMPTSAGKTLLAEFSILQAIETYKAENTRILFISPTKALCTQTYRTLASDFAGLNIPVQLASSAFEEDPFEASLLSSFDRGVVISTPEKVDLFLRSHPEWFQTVRLVVIDEAHLISDKERGVRLELLLANMRREQPTIKFLLLTPFVDNAVAVSKWLGGDRGAPININWRPSRLLVGLATVKKTKGNLKFLIEWKEPHGKNAEPKSLIVDAKTDLPSSSALDKVVALNASFQNLGLTLGMFPSSRVQAEDAAKRIASKNPLIDESTFSDELRFAIALTEAEYGEGSSLAYCLRRSTAFHHAALSPELRFLVEELGRTRRLKFLAATTTLAQGINFPVATVLVHSIHKPRGGGDLSPSEFWNIAGRAGRVGLADKGLIIFVNSSHREKWERYTEHLSESIISALLSILNEAMKEASLKTAYRIYPQIRPFIQYLAHAAATMTPRGALSSLEEIIEASFANAISTNRNDRRALRDLANRYLNEISGKSLGYLKAADTTGFSSFSFDEIFAKIPGDEVLTAGPRAVLNGGSDSLSHLVGMLAYLPELDLSLGNGRGQIDIHAVARVVDGWIGGKSVQELSEEFDGDDAQKVRSAGAYLFSTVSQTISWGAHAYIKGWTLRKDKSAPQATARDLMLPAYIQHGVNTPEAAVAALFGVPRLIAEPIAAGFREREGALTPENVRVFRNFIESADETTWSEAIGRSRLTGKVSARQARAVWRRMRGLPE